MGLSEKARVINFHQTGAGGGGGGMKTNPAVLMTPRIKPRKMMAESWEAS